MSFPRIRVSVDRGGTFTDVYAEIDQSAPDGNIKTTQHVFKLLSVDPAHYLDAPQEAIRRVLEMATGIPQPRNSQIVSECIEYIRMGTTVATNALLEKKGEPCALATTMGLRDVLTIGHQARPNIFDLKVKKPAPLYSSVVEVSERIRVVKKSEISTRDTLRSNVSSYSFPVEHPIDTKKLVQDLANIRSQGIKSLAVALMHSYANPVHEKVVRRVAEEVGFEHVSLSSELTPMVRVVPRGLTAVVDAYLSPKIKEYVAQFRSGFDCNLDNVNVQFMQSDGGLCDINSFAGYLAILSGPAGGVVGYGRTAYGCELASPEISNDVSPKPVIGFDMGGTSTDVSRFDGKLTHVFETEIANVPIQAPQLEILTVAAGGGSRLFYRSGMFHIGPESVGAHPGPVCYRKGGNLAVTDANLLLGRVVPEMFPQIFGPNADQGLDVDATRAAFVDLAKEINAYLTSNKEPEMTVEEIADGFLQVANEAMCRPIRQLTETKGFDVRNHVLACFGGAGGQHACAIAKSLGIRTVHVHKYAGVLSAYGTALADSVVETQAPLIETYGREEGRVEALRVLNELSRNSRTALVAMGIPESNIVLQQYLNLRYEGTDFGIMVLSPRQITSASTVDDMPDFEKLFEESYHQEHGFSIQGRSILIDDARVRAVGSLKVEKRPTVKPSVAPISVSAIDGRPRTNTGAIPRMTARSYFSELDGWCESPVYGLADLENGLAIVAGPSIIVDEVAGVTVVVDPGCIARVTSDGDLLIDVPSQRGQHVSEPSPGATTREMDPVHLSVYGHRFMGIAEQMGRTLQRTAVSTNIKERLDFSCALFDNTGGLVANAPHVPVHLGAMQEAVRYQIRAIGNAWKEGDVILSNHPSAGGTHLPDVTIITPVFFRNKTVFYVASRGHQADIGGITPGSMPPFSKSLDDEGMAVHSMAIVKDGRFQEEEIMQLLKKAGCRCVSDVVSDIRAQVAANTRGISLVMDLIAANGLGEVQAYMHRIQIAAANAVRDMLRSICKHHGINSIHTMNFEDHMDDGTAIMLTLSIDPVSGTANFDFHGTGKQVEGNTNAPEAATKSAIIYALRCLVNVDIPLNQGCLDPIAISIPKESILSPGARAAVVGGNVLTSQRVTDVVLGAFGACAASQGCMNNFTFGNETMGYYETIAGGCGAGPGWHGTSGVQTHMTNTRMTDAEILELRYPAVVRKFNIRDGSGGLGKWCGGNGVVRELEFIQPLTVSVLSERRTYAPWGLRGGSPGIKGVNEHITRDGTVRVLGGKSTVHVNANDRVRISTPGGGGYGNN